MSIYRQKRENRTEKSHQPNNFLFYDQNTLNLLIKNIYRTQEINIYPKIGYFRVLVSQNTLLFG